MYTLQEQLSAAMHVRNMLVSDIARALEVSNQTVRHWLKGRNYPRRQQIPKLEKLLNWNIDEAEGRTEAGRQIIEQQLVAAYRGELLAVLQLPISIRTALLRREDASPPSL